jgi:hypothetical protein
MPGPQDITEDEYGPKCVAINICDKVIIDAISQNKTLVGCFNIIGTMALPAMHPQMFVMASIWGIKRKSRFTISIRDPDYVILFSQELEADIADPLVVFDCVFGIHNLPITQLGTYFVDVQHEDQLLGERRFTVFQVEQEHAPQ